MKTFREIFSQDLKSWYVFVLSVGCGRRWGRERMMNLTRVFISPGFLMCLFVHSGVSSTLTPMCVRKRASKNCRSAKKIINKETIWLVPCLPPVSCLPTQPRKVAQFCYLNLKEECNQLHFYTTHTLCNSGMNHFKQNLSCGFPPVIYFIHFSGFFNWIS